MRFTGQVRIPEVDHPGVPATFLVDHDQAEVTLDGEPLGRWSLYDVEVTRLVASAFAVKAGDEEFTFLADEPMDFAYKGVEHMKEAWARFRAMTLPRRMVAVARTRRGTKPSRIGEVKEAMLANVGVAPRSTARLPGLGAGVDDGVKATVVGGEPSPEPAPPLTETESVLAGAGPADPTPPPLRPGAGLMAKRIVPPAPPVGEEVVTPPSPLPPPGPPHPLLDGWQGSLLTPREPLPDRDRLWEEVEETSPRNSSPVVPRSGLEDEPTLAGSTGPGEEAHLPEGEEAPLPEEPGVPAAMTPEAPDAGSPTLPQPEGPGAPDQVEEPKPLVVDLDRLEGDAGTGGDEEKREAGEDREREPVLAAAIPPPQERGGLFGAVRSAFVRNRLPHEHLFVEAPGGIGIYRQICTECGYISIGVNE